MANWRTKGVVEDSEEDEDLSSNESESRVQEDAEAKTTLLEAEAGETNLSENALKRGDDLDLEGRAKQIENFPEEHTKSTPVHGFNHHSSQDLSSENVTSQQSLLKTPPPPSTRIQSPIQRAQPPSGSETSSPLSNVPSQLGDPAPFIMEQHVQRKGQAVAGYRFSLAELRLDQQRHAQREELRQYIDVDSLDDHQVAVELSHRRNLRKRNPIQLHPYLLEGERYRNTMKARGVKPIQTTDRSIQGAPFRQETDSDQGTDIFTQQSNSSSLRNQQSSPVLPVRDASCDRSSEPTRESDALELTHDSDDNLPDISAILDRRSARSIQYGHKRRKLSHISIPSDRSQIPRSTVATQALPLSPPTSSQSPPPAPMKIGAAGFRIPRGLTSLPVTTPAQSSEIDRPAIGTAGSFVGGSPQVISSKGFSSSRRHRQIVVSSESSCLDSGSSSDDATELHHFQRRIKGVLPASWLQLDKKSRLARVSKASARTNHAPTSPRGAEPQRGVAKKVIPKTKSNFPQRRAVSSAQATWEILDDGGGSTDDQTTERARRQQMTPNPSGVLMHADSDDDPDPSDMEASWLDPMLPSAAPRRRASTNKSRKTQKKLTDTFHPLGRLEGGKRAGHQTTTKIRSGKREGQRRAHSKSRKKRLNGDAIPQMSILDIAQPANEVTSKLPQFFRVAARQAKKRADRGRQSAQDKYISLQTFQDTEDANEILHAWRAGTVAPNRHNEPPPPDNDRQALQERQANQQIASTPIVLAEQGQVTASKAIGVHTSMIKMRSAPRQQTLNSVRNSGTGQFHRSAEQQPATQKHPRSRMQHQAYNDHQGTRIAHLEALEEEFDAANPEIAFRRKLSRLSRLDSTRHAAEPTMPFKPLQTVRRPRKSAPARVDAETRSYRQPVEPLPTENVATHTPDLIIGLEQSSIQGLGPYGTHYATNFDVSPLQIGTYFRQNTFIGSGALSNALTFEHRDLDVSAPATIVVFGEHQWMWSRWDSQLESELVSIVTALSEKDSTDLSNSPSLSSQYPRPLASIIRWSSRSLFFLDPIDRGSCLSKMLPLLDTLRENVVLSTHSCSQEQLFRPTTGSSAVETLEYLAVLASQLLQISHHPAVDDKLRMNSKTFLINSCKSLLHLLLSKGLGLLRDFQESNRQHAVREAGIQQHDVAVECVVLLRHILNVTFPGKSMFWELVNEHYMPQVRSTSDVRVFDSVWYDLFTLLPFVELGVDGILIVGSRLQSSQEDWSLVKALLSQLFPLIRDGSRNPGTTVNTYFRATLARCFNLVRTWGWRKCDAILSVVFDFFAQNKLNPLRNEASIGSPRFLEQLDQDPHISLQPGDPSFHIFLKMLGLGIQGLRSIYPEKKLRSIVWRYIPNHGRTHRKEESLQQEHLDALRNHHDVLCTLYWAAPPSCRPRLDLIQNLVDHANSHIEACRLNVRSWTNLVRFLVANEVHGSILEPFALWHRDIVRVNLDQYRLARKEAEVQYRQANLGGEGDISSNLLESTIASNQRQVLAIVQDGLSSMASAVQNAKTLDAAKILLQGSSVLELLSMASFESADRKLFPVICDCLDIVLTYTTRFTIKGVPIAQQASEESQEYGDWSGFEAIDIDGSATEQSSLIFASDPIAHLVSNAFGAEVSPDDFLLVQVVDVWVMMANSFVREGSKDWGAYLGPYGLWNQMRDTEQKRRYTSYFFARVIECCPSCLAENDITIKTSWIEAIFERESRLHHQHRFTAAVLNVSKDDGLLHNLPFVARSDGTYDITLAEFRERRLSVIATLLSNIRNSFEGSECAPDSLIDTRRDYTMLLRRMQAAMRRNYEELHHSIIPDVSKLCSEVPEAQVVKGTYVAFVQSVVSLLQQYTSEIHPVDRFFTDSAAFPLPATDPTYVTGRLRSYTIRLRSSDLRTMKQLATFVLKTSERAAVDGQQTYLVSQMRAAMEDAYENSPQKPTLRRVLLLGVFPSFIDHASNSVAAALLAKPILEVSAAAFQDLVTKFNLFDRQSAGATIELCTSFLHLLKRNVRSAIGRQEFLANPYALSLATSVYIVVLAAVPLVDYLHRATGAASCAYNAVTSFMDLGLWIKALLGRTSENDTLPPPETSYSDVLDRPLRDIRTFCSSELRQALEMGWTWSRGSLYWGTRGSTRQEVVAGIGLLEDEEARLSKSIEDLAVAVQAVSNNGSAPTRRKFRIGVVL